VLGVKLLRHGTSIMTVAASDGPDGGFLDRDTLRRFERARAVYLSPGFLRRGVE